MWLEKVKKTTSPNEEKILQMAISRNHKIIIFQDREKTVKKKQT